MRIGIFILLFAVVFALATLTSREGRLSTGPRDFVSYGWPQPWLQADVVGIDITGKNYDRVRTQRTVDWRVFFISVGISACIAALLSSPLFLSAFKKCARHYARALLAIVACVAIAWATHPLLGPRQGWQANDGSWPVWVRLRYPVYLADPAWFAGGARWSLAETAARFGAIVICWVCILLFTRFRRHENPAA